MFRLLWSTQMSIPYTPELYGESFADVYDLWYSEVSDAEASADFVHSICGHGTVLELGVGSGRLAIPLIRRGTPVVGIDASLAMLRLCPRSELLTLVLGDMRTLPFDADRQHFAGVLVGFNTLFNLVTEDEQKQLFRDVYSVLRPGGHVLIEATNHDSLIHEPGISESTRSFGITRRDDSSVVVAGTDVDYRAQHINGCHVEFRDDGATLRPWMLRWASTSQLDSYASDVGLTLVDRVANWAGEPFYAHSANHVSVYQRR